LRAQRAVRGARREIAIGVKRTVKLAGNVVVALGDVIKLTGRWRRGLKNAGLPGGLGVALACGVFDIRDGRGRIEKGRACCAATRTSTARCGIKQSVLRSYGAIAEPLVP